MVDVWKYQGIKEEAASYIMAVWKKVAIWIKFRENGLHFPGDYYIIAFVDC